jgi:hypothetical protein
MSIPEAVQLLSGNIGAVVILLVLWKSGLLKYLVERKNGGEKDLNGNSVGKRNVDISAKLDLITDNHLEHVQVGIDEIKRGINDLQSCIKKANNTLENLDRFGIKIRKE